MDVGQLKGVHGDENMRQARSPSLEAVLGVMRRVASSARPIHVRRSGDLDLAVLGTALAS